MRKCKSIIFALLLISSLVLAGTTRVHAFQKTNETRAIAIVFDNSGSMWEDAEGKSIQAWCRATYAMEVFASMLNRGDQLLIYPMHPIEVGGKEYTMENPFQVTDASQAATIRDIFTKKAGATPIESVDCAIKGLRATSADKKYMIVLTDGDYFYKSGSKMSAANTKRELDTRFQEALTDMSVMYLGIGSEAVMPDTTPSEHFVKNKAENSEDVLSALTNMCNQIFGRDTLPENHISGKSINFDISMSKLIVFVQGENVSDLKVSNENGEVGEYQGATSTKYGTAGCGNSDYESIPDKSLQGMMVTYTNCPTGSYTIDYSGKATSVEVYYEPDADLDFVFTDSKGNLVDPNALYEGEYKVSFGMKDAKTGELIVSDLLGNPHYEGSYSVNGEECAISYDGHRGEVPVSLKMNDTFDAKLTATYLSGYTITKDTTDFGWPAGGIQVAARPAGDLKLEIEGGDRSYPLQKLELGSPYVAKVYYQGQQLTGEELRRVELKWDPETSNAEIKQEFANDHYNLSLHYKDSNAPANTECGRCTVFIYAHYAAPGSNETQEYAPLEYKIEDDYSTIKMNMYAPNDYILIRDLADSEAIIVELTYNGEKLSAEDFEAVELQVDSCGITYEIVPNAQDSSYAIQLLPTEGIREGKYPIDVTATHTDRVGRISQVDDSLKMTLSNTALWLKWLIGLLLLLVLIFIIWKILHIRVLPKRVKHKKDECYMSINGKNVAVGTDFNAKLSGKQLSVKTQYNGNSAGINIRNVKPGKESYLYKPKHKRSMIVSPEDVVTYGDITYADINGVGFKFDTKEGKLIPEDPDQTPFIISNNANVSFDGKAEENGRTKRSHAEIPLTFK